MFLPTRPDDLDIHPLGWPRPRWPRDLPHFPDPVHHPDWYERPQWPQYYY